jgi:hypothetical protein
MPALLKIKRSIENDIWKINFSLDTVTLPESDKELMRKFGEPTINIGGTFLEETADQYILPDKYIRIRSDLPFTQEFDSKSLDFENNTQLKALAFQTVFVDNFTSAIETLRANADTFTGEYLENI